MKTEVLTRYGIPDEVIKRWQSDGIRQLLPIQIKSVTRFGILDGKSLIIAGPGTSGKTFCGEMAALKTAATREKTAFLVPLKAIAVEKYKAFRDRYSPLGLNIRLSTRDHTDHEKDIAKNRFDILITIYEKFNSLTSSDITLIKSCRCLVLDEFQMISDPERGIELELIMAKIRKFNPEAQVVILVGGGASPECISEWLNLPVLEETRRPVDLRLGVLFRGTFHFRGFNNHEEGDEKWLREREQAEGSPIDPQVFAAIKLLAGREEQTIIFTSTKRSSVGLARYLAGKLNLKTAKNALSGLNDLPSSIQNEVLGECFFGGTAFHHAELDQQQRELVEAAFRFGEIRILVSTTTLAWGVNLPAKNVFIESMKYSGSRGSNCRETLIPLSTVDFGQAAGRAGRIGYDRDYGRAILSATSPFEQEILWENYIYGDTPVVMAGLTEELFPEFLARLICCHAIGSRPELEEAIQATFCSRIVKYDHLSRAVTAAFELLEKGGLVQLDVGDRLRVTELGKILASSGFSARSIIDINERSMGGEISTPYEWLYFSLGLEEWRGHCGSYFLNQASSPDLFKRLLELSNGNLENSNYLISKSSDANSGRVGRRVAEMLFALEWISGRAARELETLFNRGSGGLRQDALLLCWILQTISKVLELNGIKSDANNAVALDLSALAVRLKHGLPLERIALAESFDLDREFVNRLYDFGISCPDDLKKADFSLLKEMLPPHIITRISAKLKKIINPIGHEPERIVPAHIDIVSFTGRSQRVKKEILFRGRSVFLQPRLYAYFQKMWWGIKSDNPWIYRDTLDAGLNQAKYISKLRRILKDGGIDIKIISDGNGNYRLVLPESEDSAVLAGHD